MSPAVEKLLLGNRCQFNTTQKKHESFAREYMADFDLIRAYKAVYDENGTMEDIVAHKAGSRLLNSMPVQTYIDRIECEILAQCALKKEDVINKVVRVYHKAMKDRDYTAANGALDKLMKHYGLYDKHNKQRRYSADELVGIRRKLEENGVSFDAPNKPISITTNEVESAEPIEDAQIIEKEEKR